MATPQRPTLTADERPETGSRAVRRLRREGYVPGVVYGGGEEGAQAFKVPARELRRVLHDGSAVLDLKLGGQDPRPVIVKDQQRHPVRDELIHIDMLQVRLDEKIHASVSIELEGVEEAPGVKEGGVLEHVTRELNIEALPGDIPERIVVDVSGMEVAGTMHLTEVEVPAGVVLLDNVEETLIATITAPTQVAEPEVEEEAELVGAEAAGAEGETGEEAEAAEGAEPSEGEAEGGES